MASQEITRVVSIPEKVSDSFTLFPNLPAEIRLEIWEKACPNGRVIEVTKSYWEEIGDDSESEGDFQMPGGVSVCPVAMPTILHVSHESREAALRMFSRGIVTSKHPDNGNLWWNPEIDTIFMKRLSQSTIWGHSQRRLLLETTAILAPRVKEIKHLALVLSHQILELLSGRHTSYSLASNLTIHPIRYDIAKIFHDFSALETVKLLVDNYHWADEPGVMVFYEPFDVQVDSLGHMTPSEIAVAITERMEAFKNEFFPDWKVPRFEVKCILRKKLRRSGFCIPLGSDSKSRTT